MPSDPTISKGPAPRARKAITLTRDQLVRESFLPGASLPLICEPAVEGLSLLDWSGDNVAWIKSKLATVGAVLFRGFKEQTIGDFEQMLKLVAGDLLEYSYRSTPRTQVSGKIYTSTEYPAHQTIPLHNEMSYTRSCPMVLGFFCVQPAASEGETPIADSRKVFGRISPEVRQRFENKQVRYVRNYGPGLDLSWQEVFQTDDPQ